MHACMYVMSCMYVCMDVWMYECMIVWLSGCEVDVIVNSVPHQSGQTIIIEFRSFR